MLAGGGLSGQPQAHRAKSLGLPERQQLRIGTEARPQHRLAGLFGLARRLLDQPRPAPQAAPVGVYGDPGDPGTGYLQCRCFTGVGRQRLGHQVTTWASLSQQHPLGQIGIEAALIDAHAHRQRRTWRPEDRDAGRRRVQQRPQVRRGGAIVGLDQQAEDGPQGGFVPAQDIAIERGTGQLGQLLTRTRRTHPRPLRHCGKFCIQTQQRVDGPLKGVSIGPAYRRPERDGLPLGRLRLQMTTKAQRKASPRALVAVHRGGEGKPRKCRQPLAQQRRRNRRRLVHQQQRAGAAGFPPGDGVRQCVRGDKTHPPPGRLEVPFVALSLGQQRRQALEYRRHRGRPWRGHQDIQRRLALLLGLDQQAGAGDAQRRRLAATTISGDHQGAATPEPRQPTYHLGLVGAQAIRVGAV